MARSQTNIGTRALVDSGECDWVWTGGWALASAVGFSPAVLLYILVTRGNDAGQMESVAVGGGSGLVYGALTALPLCWMLREPVGSR